MAYEGFAALKSRLGKEKGVDNPAALAASIGRKKFGGAKMAQASAFGKKNPSAKPMLAPKSY